MTTRQKLISVFSSMCNGVGYERAADAVLEAITEHRCCGKCQNAGKATAPAPAEVLWSGEVDGKRYEKVRELHACRGCACKGDIERCRKFCGIANGCAYAIFRLAASQPAPQPPTAPEPKPESRWYYDEEYATLRQYPEEILYSDDTPSGHTTVTPEQRCITDGDKRLSDPEARALLASWQKPQPPTAPERVWVCVDDVTGKPSGAYDYTPNLATGSTLHEYTLTSICKATVQELEREREKYRTLLFAVRSELGLKEGDVLPESAGTLRTDRDRLAARVADLEKEQTLRIADASMTAYEVAWSDAFTKLLAQTQLTLTGTGYGDLMGGGQ
jgi:hypothetical protein